MNVWAYLDGNPGWAVLLVLVVGWTLARLVRAWRDRRPVAVRIVLACPECGAEDEGEHDAVELPGPARLARLLRTMRDGR